ncbi:hypothetical protein ACFZCT_03090 [Streptomyces qaidamensis]|jgi:hypothetical protein|uniref:hypothetical protein n=1 Tax=Streptomyces qaidamensis TaxID=1783515 RepID=UPI0036EBC98F
MVLDEPGQALAETDPVGSIDGTTTQTYLLLELSHMVRPFEQLSQASGQFTQKWDER